MSVDEEFEKIKDEGNNTVDNIINWMKEAEVINQEFTEEKARNLIDSKDSKIEFEQFKELLSNAAKELKLNSEEIIEKMKNVNENGNKIENKDVLDQQNENKKIENDKEQIVVNEEKKEGSSKIGFDELTKEFENFKRKGANDIDSIITWMKHAELINNKFTEAQARSLITTKNNQIELDQFKELVTKAAEAQDHNVAEVTDRMIAMSDKVLVAFKAGFSAFVDALVKK